MSVQSRILIVVNKYWECDPVCWVLTNKYLNDCCKVSLPWPTLVNYPYYGPVPQPSTPRLIYTSADGTTQVEVWCISDLLSVYPNTSAYQSSSECKINVLPQIFTYSNLPVNLVVAVGTASSGPFYPPYKQDNINGSVIVGSKVFMHDGHPASDPNPNSAWRCTYFDQLMNSTVATSVWQGLGNSVLETALLCPPTYPATNGQHIYTDGNYVAIGDINVTDYTEYPTKDKAAGQAFVTNNPGNTDGVSLETTHGLIYATARDAFKGDPPFLFVSGVVDRFTMFNIDVNSKVYAQNVTGAHNAGVVVAQIVANALTA
ncbi:TPA: hypothetical protein DDW35_01360 [Candidatus Sumerlaeota bacterium]|nr:hypothetical protein [Candidatus Sumerlaeota bacterium]